MTTPDPIEAKVTARARRVGKVMAIVFTAWFGAQWFGGQLGLPGNLVFVLDFIALAAFIWALFELWQIWRMTRQN